MIVSVNAAGDIACSFEGYDALATDLASHLALAFQWSGLATAELRVDGVCAKKRIAEMRELVARVRLLRPYRLVRPTLHACDAGQRHFKLVEENCGLVTSFGEAFAKWGVWNAREHFWERPHSMSLMLRERAAEQGFSPCSCQLGEARGKKRARRTLEQPFVSLSEGADAFYPVLVYMNV
jgi:hypothetical protein